MNNGQWLISDDGAGFRLDKWLASMRRLGSHQRALEALGSGRVFVNKIEQTVNDAERILQSGDAVRVWIDRRDIHTLPFVERQFDFLHIIYEDRHLLVLNKPAGLLSVPHPYKLDDESLFDLAEEYLNSKKRQPFVVHRIDRGTTGLVLFAKSLEAQQRLREQFERREPERAYRAVIRGIPNPEAGTWRNWLVWNHTKRRFVPADQSDPYAREAICHYQLLERFDGAVSAALIEVHLVTGKRNQIRIQAQMHGHPLIGERIFTDRVYNDIPFKRQALHAYRLKLRHPINNRVLEFEAPLPDDFIDLLNRLRQPEPQLSRVNAN